MMSPVSICICTYNRCDELQITLDSLVQSKSALMPEDEVLVIDNNSDDLTRTVVERFTTLLPLRYIFEPEQGLSAARNRAINEYRNDVIVFFDDDVTVSTEFIKAYRIAITAYLDHGFFGGRLHVDWLGNSPGWLHDESLPLINGLLCHYDLGDYSFEYGFGDLLPYGANFALRRNTVEVVGRFDPSLGVKGAEIGRGEESDYFQRAMKAGVRGMYLPNAKAGHRFQRERIGMVYLYRYGVQKGRAISASEIKPQSPWIVSCVMFGVRGLFQLIKGRRDRFYQCVINIGIVRGRLRLAKPENERS